MCNNDYELLETFQKDKETWSYLRHKKTGLEIAYHQYETWESGFSFTFRTPIEEQYLGTSHVLEHCVLKGAQKYDVDIWELQRFALFSSSNAFTDEYSTTYFFNSNDEAEVFKLIPILEDYVFFPTLTEEAFLQECFHVDFDPEGDGRKKDIMGVVYNEMRSRPPETYCVGGIYYKLHELTNDKIREYHKKYYRPDNCLFNYEGTAALDDVLLQVDKFIPEMEKKFKARKSEKQNALTIKDFLQRIADRKVSESFADYWSVNNETFTPEPLPPKKSIPKIISEYLSKFTPQEYQSKLEKLHEWQARDLRETAYKIMAPHNILDYDLNNDNLEESLWKDFEGHKWQIVARDRKHPDVYTEIDKKSCSIILRASQLLSREYYSEYALMFFLQYYIPRKLRKLGRIYGGGFFYKYPADFVIASDSTDKPEKTIEAIKKCFKEIVDYNFNEKDLLSIRYIIFSFLLSQEHPEFYFTNEIFSITPEELHQAAVRFSDMIYPPKKDEGDYYTLGDVLKH